VHRHKHSISADGSWELGWMDGWMDRGSDKIDSP
jgi:hypothetical protein